MANPSSDPLDPLYAVPLADFVAERNRLATDLRKQGDKQAAAAIKAAVKPSASAWAVNQAVRRAPQILRRLLAASDALRKAQLDGGGETGRARYQKATADHRQVLDEFIEQALAALTEAGTAASPALRERIAGNLRWGAQSRESRQMLEAGRLTRDVGPQDFEALARMAGAGDLDDEKGAGKVISLGRPAAARPPQRDDRSANGKGPKEKASKGKEAAADKADRVDAAEKEREAARRQREKVADLRAQQRTRRQEADKAGKERTRAAAEVERQKERVATLETQLSEARAALEVARREDRRASEAMMRAETTAREAERALGQAEGD